MRGDVVERDTVKQHTPGVGGWIALVSTALLTPATLVANVWLLWRYVPAQVAALAEFEMSLPLSTRITIAASSWFVRMLPFAIFASMLLGPLLLGAAIYLDVDAGLMVAGSAGIHRSGPDGVDRGLYRNHLRPDVDSGGISTGGLRSITGGRLARRRADRVAVGARAVEQGDEADEAFGGTVARTAR